MTTIVNLIADVVSHGSVCSITLMRYIIGQIIPAAKDGCVNLV